MVNFDKLTSDKGVLQAICEVRTIRQRMMNGTHTRMDTVLLARRLQLISKSTNSQRIMQVLFL